MSVVHVTTTIKMSILWKKENSTTYVDIFDKIPRNLLDQFKEWDQRSDWKHRFLETTSVPIKSNLIASEFNNKGNECYYRGEWRKAIEFYNRGMCFAQTNSAHFNVMRTKRGFCFSNMSMFKEGIDAIDCLLSTKYLPQWRRKLQRERKKWIALERETEDNNQNQPIVPQLSFEADDTTPCLANVLEIKEDNESRSYVVAKCDIDVGQVVLVEESFTSVANGYDRAYCFTCLSTGNDLIPCQQCTDVMFCNDDCMKRNKIHELSCGDDYHRMPIEIKFVIQSILEAITLFPSINRLIEFVEAPGAYLPKTTDYMNEAKIYDYGLFLCLLPSTSTPPTLLVYQAYTTMLKMTAIKRRFNMKFKQRFLMHLICHHAQVLRNNAFYGDFEGNSHQFSTAAMSSVVALFEQSCTPNLMHFSIANREILITSRPVMKGDYLCYQFWPKDLGGEQQTGNVPACKCGKCNPQYFATNQAQSEDPSFYFVASYKKYFGNETSSVLKGKCVNFLRKFKDVTWSKEIDIITKTYTQCLLADFNCKSSK